MILTSVVMFIGLWTTTVAQQTSMIIECLNPGSLSNMIDYPNQQTLENIKITGYINGDDIKFLNTPNNNHVLTGIIDLEEVNIVKGGYYSKGNNIMPSYIFKDHKKTYKNLYIQIL